MNVFVRYTEGMDLTDWETKEGLFKRMTAELGAEDRIRIFKEEFEGKEKSYGIELFFDFIRRTEKVIGEPVDGLLLGSDYEKIKPELEEEFPNMKFIITQRRGGVNSTAIRKDLEGHREWLPTYVYEALKNLKK